MAAWSGWHVGAHHVCMLLGAPSAPSREVSTDVTHAYVHISEGEARQERLIHSPVTASAFT